MEEITIIEEPLDKDKLEEYLQGLPEEDKKFIENKINLAYNEKGMWLKDNINFYLASIRYLFSTVQRNNLTDEEKVKFWEEVNMYDFLFDINKIGTVVQLFSKLFFQIDCQAEALTLMVMDYFLKIKTRIRRNK